jgi:hypothetical protein
MDKDEFTNWAEGMNKKYNKIHVTYNFNSNIHTFNKRIYEDFLPYTPEFKEFLYKMHKINNYPPVCNYVEGVRIYKFGAGTGDGYLSVKFFTSPENIKELVERIENDKEIKKWLTNIKQTQWEGNINESYNNIP